MPEAAAKHIVIVDDDPYILEILERYLTGAHFQVSAVRRASMARAILLRSHVDIVLADAHLPGENGIELTRAAAEFGIPTLIMTGDADWAIDRGAAPQDLLVKPFGPAHAERRILAALAA